MSTSENQSEPVTVNPLPAGRISLLEASRLSGITKNGLLKAIKTGRLSATRNDDGNWLVDVAELQRTYPLKPPTEPTEATPEPVIQPEHRARLEAAKAALEAKAELLTEKIAGLERTLEQIESERDHLRESLRAEAEERRSLTRLITDQRAQPEPENQPRTMIWVVVTAAILVVAVIAWFAVTRPAG